MTATKTVHDALDAFFGERGPLAKRLSGYKPRAPQIDMAHKVADALATKSGRLAVEAGTGTGKSMAYLAAALLSGKRFVVTTGTKALQDQLYTKDVPLALAAVAQLQSERAPLDDDAVLMKGRSNYLCKLRFEKFALQPLFAFSAEALAFQQIVRWEKHTRIGDRAEITSLPEPYTAWSEIDAGSETCIGMKCKVYDQCFVVQMRRRAEGSRLIVANHHLLCADLRLRLELSATKAAQQQEREGPGAHVIPDVDAVIVDEAHTLPDIASDSFGITVGTHALSRVHGDVRRFADGLGGDDRAAVLDAVLESESAIEQLFAPLAGRYEREREKLTPPPTAQREKAASALASLKKQLASLPDETLQGDVDKGAMRTAERANLGERVENARGEIEFVLGRAFDDPRFVVLGEPVRKGAKVTAAPVDVAAALEQTLFARPQPVVMTSATLAVAGDVSAFLTRAGLPSTTAQAVMTSPFDFAKRAALYCPRDMPEPAHPGFFPRFIDECRFLLETTRGGALFLFTSLAAMDEGYDALLPAARKLGVPTFKQGDMQKGKLLDELRARDGDTGALLCATRSFWEGVDVRGRALRLVVVDRLPFDVPTDPLRKARAELCKKKGGDPFRDIALPEAALALKQGAGRLLRDVDDAGVVAVLDGRLRSKSYGKTFLDTLPAMTRIGARPALAEFFRRFVEPTLGLSSSGAEKRALSS